MRLLRSRAAAATCMAAVLCLAMWSAPAMAEPLSSDRVKQVVDAVRADADLGGTRTVRTLHLKPSQSDPDDEPRPPSAPWLRELVRWLAESGRLLVWLGGAAAVALLIVFLRRWISEHGDDGRARALVLPSHVRDLDIRPESLPDDIGAAARALWQRGEQRAALSLLYRGALSRLVHGHAVPIRAASTEGECVSLASRRLPTPSTAFFERLVRAWQTSVYGAHPLDGASVLALCDDFDVQLPAQTEPVAA